MMATAVRRYDLEAFDDLLIDTAFIPKGPSDSVALSDQLPAIDDLVALKLPTWLINQIVDGNEEVEDEDGLTRWRYPSRNEAIWRVECELAEHGHPDDVIAAILLDPRNAISQKPLEQRDPKRWVAADLGRMRKHQERKPNKSRRLRVVNDTGPRKNESDTKEEVVEEQAPSSGADVIRAAAAVYESRTIGEVVATFQKWLYLGDTGPVLVVLATIAANLMPGDPLWLMLVGASSGGKTEILNASSRLAHVHLAATLTEAALLSGTPKRDKAKTAKGGLLREIGAFGILLLKDFTSILSMKHEARAALLAALREIFDGSWSRHVGADGGRELAWEGKLGLVACCTTTIDTYHAVTAAMGERFLLYRLPEIEPQEQARRALKNAGHERDLRQDLMTAVGGLFAGIEIPDELPEIPDDDNEQLIALATLAARARSAVERDGRTRDIELIPDPEAPARLAQALRRLYSGLRLIGVLPGQTWDLVFKVGLDCMPKLRRSVFQYLIDHPGWSSTTAVATDVGYPTQTARRSLEDLAVHHLVLRKVGGKGKPDSWQLSDLAKRWYSGAGGTVPENSPTTMGDSTPDRQPTLLESEQCIEEEFSGTPSNMGSGAAERACWSCHEGALSLEGNERCEHCGWLICSCGACSRECAPEVIGEAV